MANPNVAIDLTARTAAAQAAFAKLSEVVKRFAQRTGAILQKWSKRVLMAGVAAGTYFVKLAADQEAAIQTLNSALTANGYAVVAWSGTLQKAAAELQELSVYGDEVLMPIMALGMNMGISAAKIKDATQAAVGLSAVYGMDLTQSIKLVATAQMGEYTMLQRYLPQLRTTTDETEKAAIVQKLLQRAWKQAEIQTKTFRGRLSQLMNRLSDMGEEVGMKLMPIFEKFTDVLDYLSGKITTETIVSFGTWTAAIALAIAYGPKLIAVIIGITKALMWMYGASGPAGAALVVGGLAIVGAAVYRLKSEYDELMESAEAAAESAAKIAKNAPAAIGGQKLSKEQEERQEKRREAAGLWPGEVEIFPRYQETKEERKARLTAAVHRRDALYEKQKEAKKQQDEAATERRREAAREAAAGAWEAKQEIDRQEQEKADQKKQELATYAGAIRARIAAVPGFQAGFVGLGEMQKKIQAAAASTSPEKRQEELLKKMVAGQGDELKKIVEGIKQEERTTSAIDKLAEKLGPMIVGI